MTSVIVGMGQIGQSVKQIITTTGKVYSWDKTGKQSKVYGYVDVMHVCFGYSDNFVSEVKKYAHKFKPEHIIIWSTVPIGTTRQIKGAVHSPVEGKHPDLATSIRIMPRWIGFNEREEGNFFAEFFLGLSMKVQRVPNSDFTEALKLLSTTEYGLNVEFARYKNQIADSLGMDYELMKEWNVDYNDLYRDLNMTQYKKYILDPPDGPKGGHCITPNSRLLHEQYPSDFTRIVGEIYDRT